MTDTLVTVFNASKDTIAKVPTYEYTKTGAIAYTTVEILPLKSKRLYLVPELCPNISLFNLEVDDIPSGYCSGVFPLIIEPDPILTGKHREDRITITAGILSNGYFTLENIASSVDYDSTVFVIQNGNYQIYGLGYTIIYDSDAGVTKVIFDSNVANGPPSATSLESFLEVNDVISFRYLI